MSRKTRGELIDPNEVTIVHTVAKAARNLFLLGEDFATKTQNSHRKDWIMDILEFQSSLMAIDLLDFSLLCNHIHQVLRSRPDAVKQWDNYEVARRWMNLCPTTRKKLQVADRVERVAIPPRETQIQTLANNPRRIKEIRERLSSISWWMRLLCQKVAQRANFEDGGSKGPFWKGRFHSTVIQENSHLLGCCLYVDLNAVKAGLAQCIQDYDYTSAKIRLEKIKATQQATEDQQGSGAGQIVHLDPLAEVSVAQAPEEPSKPKAKDSPQSPKPVLRISQGEFLSLMKLDQLSSNPQLHTSGFRCSDKGFLDYSVREYLEVLEWCIRNKITEPEAQMPAEVPACLSKHPLGPEMVVRQAREFGRMYRYRTSETPKTDHQQQCVQEDSGS